MSGFPAVVLVVGSDAPRRESYWSALEEAGFWVAEAACVEDVVRDIADLRPDVVITNRSRTAPRGHRSAFVRAIKPALAASAVPLILIEDPDVAAEPLPELGALDARLVKPVSPVALRNAVERARAAARAVRRRGQAARTASGRDSRRSRPHAAMRATGHTEAGHTDAARRCPACGRPVVWVERNTVDGVEYDYFQWCEGRCGLYCLEVATGQWLKLA
jgi:AmiR/NasT family two-component response regulator